MGILKRINMHNLEPVKKRLSSPNDSIGDPELSASYKTGFPITPSGMTQFANFAKKSFSKILHLQLNKPKAGWNKNSGSTLFPADALRFIHPNFFISLLAEGMLLLFLLLPTPAIADNAKKAGEFELKAAFIYNFTKFIDWPESSFKSSTAPFKICIIDSEEFQKASEILSGRLYKSRKIEVLNYTSPNDIEHCNIVFISSKTDSATIGKILNIVKRKPLLTIGESDDFIKHGGIITFIDNSGKIAFNASPKAAKTAGLSISSKLLQLSKNRGENE